MSEEFLSFIKAEVAYNTAVAKAAVGHKIDDLDKLKKELQKAKDALYATGHRHVGEEQEAVSPCHKSAPETKVAALPTQKAATKAKEVTTEKKTDDQPK